MAWGLLSRCVAYGTLLLGIILFTEMQSTRRKSKGFNIKLYYLRSQADFVERA